MITPAVVVIVSIFSLGEATSWPDGTYCLPMPSNGQCPRGWARGERRHDTEDDNCSSYCSKKQHGWVPYHSDLCRNLGWGFCCKTSNGTTGNTWPRGSYCIFRKGGYCPTGFASGRNLISSLSNNYNLKQLSALKVLVNLSFLKTAIETRRMSIPPQTFTLGILCSNSQSLLSLVMANADIVF